MGNNIHPFFPENPPNFLPFPPEKEKTRSKETQFAVSANPPSSCEQRTQKRDHPPTYFWRPDTHTAITRNLLRNLTTTPNPSFPPSTSRLVNFCASHAACHLLSLPFSHRPVFRHPNLTVASLLTHTWDWGERALYLPNNNSSISNAFNRQI